MTEFKTPVVFSFYDFGIKVESSDRETIDNVHRDFSFFVSPNTDAEIIIQAFPRAPDYHALPKLQPSLRTPRNFCYRQKDMLFIDYFGKGLSIIDLKKKEYKVYSLDSHLRHEIVFLTILSLVGEDFDKRHIHRIHGLGLEINGKAVLILLPQGGGKTTLMLELIKEKGVRLISEDSPLMNSSGEILSFPIRIGIDGENYTQSFPKNFVRLVQRMEFGPKYLLDIEYFKDKIVSYRSRPDIILNGVRCLGGESDIKPVSKSEILRAFMVNAVIGLGIYQGIEFLIETSPLELLKKSRVLVSRFSNSWKVVSKAKAYNFFFGYDIKKNCETLINFISNTDIRS